MLCLKVLTNANIVQIEKHKNALQEKENEYTVQTEKHKNEIQQKENELSLLMEKYNNLKKELEAQKNRRDIYGEK